MKTYNVLLGYEFKGEVNQFSCTLSARNAKQAAVRANAKARASGVKGRLFSRATSR